MVGAVVWLVEYALPLGSDPEKRRHQICVTDSAGQCFGVVEYTYPVRRWPWQRSEGGRTSPRRFEMLVKLGDHRASLGFLDPLTSHQLHGAEPIIFVGKIEESVTP